MIRLRPAPLALIACLASLAAASEYHETDDFADAAAAVERYAERFGAGETLLVVDIDNTLLAMGHPLGSDQWFEWQEYLLEQEPDSPDLVADDFAGLLDVQGLLFTLGKMRPPQANLPELVARLQTLGVPTLVLTSRGPQYRAATQRELEACGYNLAPTAIETQGLPTGDFEPYDPTDPTAAGLTADEFSRYRLRSPRLVSYEDGVFMTSGQHKGAMLLTLLEHAVKKPKAVVFVDDHGRHIHRVRDALERRGIEASVFHYSREDNNVERFRYADKSDVTRRWRRLESALGEVFAMPAAAAAPEPAAALAP